MVKWDLNQIIKERDLDKTIFEVHDKLKKFEKDKDKLSPNIDTKEFLRILKEYEEINILITKLFVRSYLRRSENTSDLKANSFVDKIHKLSAEVSNKTLFFTLFIKDLDDKNFARISIESGKYKYFLGEIRRFKPYMLSENEEKLLNLKDLVGKETIVKIYDMLTNSFTYKISDKTEEINQSELIEYVRNSKPELRKEAYEVLLNKYAENEAIISEIFSAVQRDVEIGKIKIRNFKHPMQPTNLQNDIPDEIVGTLLKVTKKNSKLFSEYFKAKFKYLGIKGTRYDIYAPIEATDKKYDFDQAKDIVLNTFRDFNEEFFKAARKIFDEKTIHSDLTKNKMSGAYCYSYNYNKTPFVLMNFVGNTRDVETLAHELGHAVHSIMAKEQTQFTFQASTPMAEVASIFAEEMLKEKLLAKAEKKEKIAILARELDNLYATILRQAYFVLFEREAFDIIQEGGNAEQLNKEYYNLLKEQFHGIEIPESFKHEWKYIPHLFHHSYYCYSYAFGNLLTLALYNMYKQKGRAFAMKYLEVLKSGGSDSPENILMNAGININQEKFWQSGFDIIEAKIKEFKRLIEEN